MSFFSYHILRVSFWQAIRLWFFSSSKVEGMVHSETMNVMTLGAPLFSLKRILIREYALFAQWNDENALENFLNQDRIGKLFNKGWHVRMKFVRKWGDISGFDIPKTLHEDKVDGAVVAVTIARMKPSQIPRFIRWGRPVEKLVRDHPGAVLSLASIRFPNTVSTFSIWPNHEDMIAMVNGHSKMPNPTRHFDAMKERDRKDFHFEFTTLRFKPLAEYGNWKEKSNYTR